MKSGNGAITISDVAGYIGSSVGNGVVTLANLAGQVSASTGNGSSTIKLTGDHWDGASLTIKSGNGEITVHVPHDYAAHFDASTGIGAISTHYPVHVAKAKWDIPALGGKLTFDAGIGGAPIRLTTGIGSIKIQMEP